MKLRGFTIVEVVVAVAIVTLLAAIVIPDLWAAQQRITGEMFMNNVHDIITTLELYKKEHSGLYPTQLEELASYFDKQPINQYTKSSMLSSDVYQSGVQYTPSADRKSYTLVVTQRDVNDLDRDKNKTETVPEALGQPFSFGNVQPTTPTVARTYIITLRTVPNNTGQLVAFPNPAKAGQTVMLSQKPANCYDFGSWSSPDVTITNNSFVMPAKDVTVTASYTIRQYTVSAAPNNPSYGTVTGSGTYNCGSTATLTAEPNTGYTFVGWYEDGNQVSTATTYTFTVYDNHTLEARFRSLTYTIVVTASPVGVGTQTATPNPAYVGQTVTLSATPTSCYKFSGWLSPDATISNPLSPTASFIMPEKNATIIANYTIQKYTITATNVQYGTVTGTGTYNCGSTATLTAVPATEFTFTGWYEDGSLVSTATTYIFTVSSTRTLEARFKQVKYHHTITITETTQADFSSGTLSNVTAAADRLELVPWVDSFTTTLNYTAEFDSDATWQWNTTQGTLVANNGQQSLRLVSNYSATDVDMEVDMTQANDSGLVARFQDNSNYYLLAIRDDSSPASKDNLQVYKRQNGNYTSLAVANVTWPRGTQATIRFVVKGNTLKAYFNGTEVINIIDSTFTTAGLVGLRHHGTVESVYQEFRVNSGYTASGTRTSPEYNISTTGTVESATITWTANTPAGTSATVETRVSLDGGNTWTSWQTVASGSAVPGLPKGTSLANARIQTRQTLSTTNSATTPQLQDVTIQLAYVSDFKTIDIIETTQTDFSSGTLSNVTATDGNITLDGQNQPNKEIIQQNTPYILPDAFWNGSKYKYIVFATSTPNFTGGSGVSIINRGIASSAQTSDVGNSYEITSSTRITSITADGVTLSNFTYREGDIFWYGPWWNAAVAQTIPSGYDIAFAIGRTENLGTSSWVVRLDGVDTAFSTNVANHYFRAPINSSTSHSILVTYITGGKGIQFAYWGYAKAYPSSGTRTSPEYNISTAGTVESATITWTASTPAGTSVTVETRVSLDGGNTWTSWQTVANGSAIPGLPKGTSLANARIQTRQTLSTTNSTITPQLWDVTIQLAYVSDYRTIDITETTQTDFQSGTLSNVTANNGNLILNSTTMLYYNGNDNYAYIPFINNTTFGSQFTIEMLVNISPSMANNGAVLFSISRTRTDVTNEALLVLIPTGQGAKLRFWDYSTTYGFPENSNNLSTIVLQPNQTYHIAFVKNGLTGTYYVNGQPAGTVSAAVDVHCGNDNVYLGADFRDNKNYYNGYMDEVRIWNVARSAADIQADMNHELVGNEPGLVGYWRLNEGTGITIYDSTSNGSNGTINGAQWVINYTASGTRTSPEYNISTTGTVEFATITWIASTPAGTSATVETRVSLDGGNTWTSWQTVANGSAIPGLPKGTSLANARIQLRQTLSTTNSAITPQLQDVRIQIVSTGTRVIRVDVKQMP